jgi:hypothetical protein
VVFRFDGRALTTNWNPVMMRPLKPGSHFTSFNAAFFSRYGH